MLPIYIYISESQYLLGPSLTVVGSLSSAVNAVAPHWQVAGGQLHHRCRVIADLVTSYACEHAISPTDEGTTLTIALNQLLRY